MNLLRLILLTEEILYHPGCKQLCKCWDKLPTSTGAGFLNHQQYIWNLKVDDTNLYIPKWILIFSYKKWRVCIGLKTVLLTSKSMFLSMWPTCKSNETPQDYAVKLPWFPQWHSWKCRRPHGLSWPSRPHRKVLRSPSAGTPGRNPIGCVEKQVKEKSNFDLIIWLFESIISLLYIFVLLSFPSSGILTIIHLVVTHHRTPILQQKLPFILKHCTHRINSWHQFFPSSCSWQ